MLLSPDTVQSVSDIWKKEGQSHSEARVERDRRERRRAGNMPSGEQFVYDLSSNGYINIRTTMWK